MRALAVGPSTPDLWKCGIPGNREMRALAVGPSNPDIWKCKIPGNAGNHRDAPPPGCGSAKFLEIEEIIVALYVTYPPTPDLWMCRIPGNRRNHNDPPGRWKCGISGNRGNHSGAVRDLSPPHPRSVEVQHSWKERKSYPLCMSATPTGLGKCRISRNV